jgi:hypothetical protein
LLPGLGGMAIVAVDAGSVLAGDSVAGAGLIASLHALTAIKHSAHDNLVAAATKLACAVDVSKAG